MAWQAIMVSTGEVIAESENYQELIEKARGLVPSTAANPMPYFFTTAKGLDKRHPVTIH